MFCESQLLSLRADISGKMSPSRLEHTLGVERMAVRLGELYAPEKIPVLVAAALLHDITKENSFQKQLQICDNLGIMVSCDEKNAPKTLHAITASAIIPSEYPDFAVSEILDAVRWHTTGRAGMSICEKLIYLADYIEDTRKFEDCVYLREYFFDADPSKMSMSDRLIHLDRTLLLSFDMTIRQLVDEGSPIHVSTFSARNHLIIDLSGKDSPDNSMFI
ncbi:MAG: bis(5'-nucleosyl)-tetraphosphatase (symmetrical) YqeK [Clostridia bacterium]|nr:bis(5'-nucleosyl)-tetraphosphatase (symmetrical) YqeK [Clostridia bacterium]